MAKLYPDISHYHPVSDWDKVQANCPFLISKGTQGTSYIDTTLDDFIAGCEKKKIPYWLYTYLNKGDELAQAKFLVSACKSKIGDYFVGYILDVEAGNTAANVKSALDYLSGLGVKTMIYTMYSQYDTYKSVITGRPSDCAFWEARYGANNGSYSAQYAPHSGADLHQYTSKGSCSGVSGQVDLNRISGSKDEDWFKTANATKASNTTSASAAKKTTLDVDGKWGSETCKRAQEVFGTTVDGYISGQLPSVKKYHDGVSCAKYVTKGSGSQLIRAIQKKVKATQDGQLGPKTITAMQKWLSTTQDGYISNPSLMVKAFQKWLNKQ
ncbi:MAG: hypothetical protein LUD01_01455 [Clostridiales bacterium]|nr:hypothetical protein [Clostridiales bacterium]